MFEFTFEVNEFLSFISSVKAQRIILTTGNEMLAMLGKKKNSKIDDLKEANDTALDNLIYYRFELLEEIDNFRVYVEKTNLDYKVKIIINFFLDFFNNFDISKIQNYYYTINRIKECIHHSLFSAIKTFDKIFKGFIYLYYNITEISDICFLIDYEKYPKALSTYNFSKNGSPISTSDDGLLIPSSNSFSNILYCILPKTKLAIKIFDYMITDEYYPFGRPDISEVIDDFDNEGEEVSYKIFNGSIV